MLERPDIPHPVKITHLRPAPVPAVSPTTTATATATVAAS
jgi:hypothetical protein